MLYKLENGSLIRAPKYIIDNGTTYINNEEKLREKGFKDLVHDSNIVDGSYIVSTTYTEDDNNIYEHYEWAKYEDVQTPQEPTIEERLTETESNVTELQMALCDLYESVGDTNA